MSEQVKMNLGELKKSFPSLDDYATKKLLGGWVDPNSKPAPAPNTGSNPGSTTSGATTASTSHPTSAGDMYFGDSDYDQGDGGWGDWGDDGPGGDAGGDSNPGGSEGGNGQNSSGNPGGQGQQGELPINNTGVGNRPFQVQNGWPVTIYAKPENNVPAAQRPNVIVIPPGGTTNVPIDGLSINGIIYKFVNGYGWIEVHPNEIITNYPWYLNIGQMIEGGVLGTPPDDDAYPGGVSGWQDLFDAP